MQPDPRITMRNVINRRDLAVVILLGPVGIDQRNGARDRENRP
jgi:hypothetical protein